MKEVRTLQEAANKYIQILMSILFFYRIFFSTEESTSPESGVKELGGREREARGEAGESRSPSPASRASPTPEDRDIEHSIPATLIQDPNAERYTFSRNISKY